MAVRNTMNGLIARVRQLINDPAGLNQIFSDQDVQDVMDASRLDVKSQVLVPKPTYTGSTIQYLDYYATLGDWEDDVVLKQYLTVTVTPSLSEPIPGHWAFAQTTLPPLYISGKTYDVYRSAADLLERWAARWVLSYSVTVNAQSLQRGQVVVALQNLAHTYRMKQRAVSLGMSRPDVENAAEIMGTGLGPSSTDYMASGDGR